jgi:hypothetical protein
MKTAGQWCDSAVCPDGGKSGANNLKMHRYAARRLRCTTCQRTVSADKGTGFETRRTPRPILLDVVAMRVERHSLRAVSRIKPGKTEAALPWWDLAGQQGTAVHRHLVRDGHPTQGQVDALWSCVQKTQSPCHQAPQLPGGTPAFGVRSPCRGLSASCPLCRPSTARRRRRPCWRPSKPALPGTRHGSPGISCRWMSRPSWPTPARPRRLWLHAGGVAHAAHRAEGRMRHH